MAQFQAEDVRRYYDNNTRLFLSLGQGTEGTIHRAIWGPGVDSRVEAMAYVDTLVAERIAQLDASRRDKQEALHIADLGCGVCASLCRLAASPQLSKSLSQPLRGTGVTISPKQVQLATERIASADLSDRVSCVHGDFCNLPSELAPADLAFGVESFVHAPSPSEFFREAATLVRSGGQLIVCDDFVVDARFDREQPSKRCIERFRRGWVASNVTDLQTADALAKEQGFVRRDVVDLTPYLELGRPRDRVVAAFMRVFGWVPPMGSYYSMIHGGHALQVGLQKGWLQHLFVVWERQ